MADLDENRDAEGNYIGPDEKTITLRKPIETGKTTAALTELNLREPQAGELAQSVAKQRATNEYEGNLLLISLVSGWILPDCRKLPQREFEEACEFLQGFSKVLPVTPSAA